MVSGVPLLPIWTACRPQRKTERLASVRFAAATVDEDPMSRRARREQHGPHVGVRACLFRVLVGHRLCFLQWRWRGRVRAFLLDGRRRVDGERRLRGHARCELRRGRRSSRHGEDPDRRCREKRQARHEPPAPAARRRLRRRAGRDGLRGRHARHGRNRCRDRHGFRWRLGARRPFHAGLRRPRRSTSREDAHLLAGLGRRVEPQRLVEEFLGGRLVARPHRDLPDDVRSEGERRVAPLRPLRDLEQRVLIGLDRHLAIAPRPGPPRVQQVLQRLRLQLGGATQLDRRGRRLPVTKDRHAPLECLLGGHPRACASPPAAPVHGHRSWASCDPATTTNSSGRAATTSAIFATRTARLTAAAPRGRPG